MGDNNLPSVKAPYRKEPRLAIVKPPILEGKTKFREYQLRILEIEAMFNEIAAIFARIPFKLHL
jgi:hypothetical protein